MQKKKFEMIYLMRELLFNVQYDKKLNSNAKFFADNWGQNRCLTNVY